MTGVGGSGSASDFGAGTSGSGRAGNGVKFLDGEPTVGATRSVMPEGDVIVGIAGATGSAVSGDGGVIVVGVIVGGVAAVDLTAGGGADCDGAGVGSWTSGIGGAAGRGRARSAGRSGGGAMSVRTGGGGGLGMLGNNV